MVEGSCAGGFRGARGVGCGGDAVERIIAGAATSDAATTIQRRLLTVTDTSRCCLPTQEQRLIASLLDRYPADIATRTRRVPGDVDVVLPKLLDLRDGIAHSDPRAGHKRPDWTHSETPVRLTDR